VDKANTEAYGTPVPTTVPMKVEKGPFIVASGHDLNDLYRRWSRRKTGASISIPTGEMLPAHAYPKLKAYTHAQRQISAPHGRISRRNLTACPGIPVHHQCLNAAQDSYRDRVFTTAVVSYPGLVHIGEEKDFTPVSTKAWSWAATRKT
jgi:hydroxylamine reductase